MFLDGLAAERSYLTGPEPRLYHPGTISIYDNNMRETIQGGVLAFSGQAEKEL